MQLYKQKNTNNSEENKLRIFLFCYTFKGSRSYLSSVYLIKMKTVFWLLSENNITIVNIFALVLWREGYRFFSGFVWLPQCKWNNLAYHVSTNKIDKCIVDTFMCKLHWEMPEWGHCDPWLRRVHVTVHVYLYGHVLGPENWQVIPDMVVCRDQGLLCLFVFRSHKTVGTVFCLNKNYMLFNRKFSMYHV